MGEQHNFKGLELLFKAHRSDFHSRNDCLVAAVHILMINARSKCAGIGDEWTDDVASLSELLPENWNSNQDVYTLRYVSESPSNKYLLKIVKAGNALLLNVVSLPDEKAAGLSINADRYIAENFSEFAATFQNMDELGKKFDEELAAKIFPVPASQSNCPGPSGRSDRQPPRHSQPSLLIDDRAIPMRGPQRVSFPSVGRGDLDPLSGGFGGGGMLFDPRSIHPRSSDPPFGIGGPSLPRGSVPPGARFDPIGPPGHGRGRSFPDSDFPPPDFENYFM